MFLTLLQKDPPYFFAVVITVVVSITIHELAHGIVAIWLGDRTPIDEERMTLNPIVHLGPFSIIALLIAGIAWGAMPINPSRLRGRYGEALVAVAGPVSNVLLSAIALIALGLWWRADGDILPRGSPAGNFQFLLSVFGHVNLMLALFNLIPVPPLDGSRILENFSNGYKNAMEKLSATGGTVMVFFLAFMLAGKVIDPAVKEIRRHVLQALCGFEIVFG